MSIQKGRSTFKHWKALPMVGRGEFSQLPLHHLYVYSKGHILPPLISVVPLGWLFLKTIWFTYGWIGTNCVNFVRINSKVCSVSCILIQWNIRYHSKVYFVQKNEFHWIWWESWFVLWVETGRLVLQLYASTGAPPLHTFSGQHFLRLLGICFYGQRTFWNQYLCI